MQSLNEVITSIYTDEVEPVCPYSLNHVAFLELFHKYRYWAFKLKSVC
jgi:hypothetical protein